MKKNITSMIQRGNIKPKDRVKLLVMDMANKERNGKALLTEADRYALGEGWTPKNNYEVQEYNRFSEGWKNTAYAELDAQIAYLTAIISILRAGKAISLLCYKNYVKKDDQTLKEIIGNASFISLLRRYKQKEAIAFVLAHSGLEINYAIYLYALELASKNKKLQKELLALSPNDQIPKGWQKVLVKARKTIQGLVNNGKLKTVNKMRMETKELAKTFLNRLVEETRQDRQDTPKTETKTIITGESLYTLKGNYQFIKEFKKQVESFKILGAVGLYLKECGVAKKYSTLLGFLELFKALSKAFNTDLTYSIKKWVESFNEEVELFKMELLMLADEIEANNKDDRIYCLTNNFLEELITTLFDLANIKPDLNGRIKTYYKKIKNQLEDDLIMPYFETKKNNNNG